MTLEIQIIDTLARSDSAMTCRQLVKAINGNSTYMTVLCKSLRDQGLIQALEEKVRPEGKGRAAFQYVATEKGVQLVKAVKEGMKANDAE